MTKTDIDMKMELLGALVLTDLGERWGALATAVQCADARAILSEDGPRRHWLGRARGYSKTTDVAAFLIVLLLTLAYGSECAAAAADADQAAILVRRMRGLLRRTKALTDAFEVTARRVTCKRTGSFVEVLAADGASAWGLLPPVVVLDEFPMWRDTENARELFDALTSALPKVAGSRLIIMGTAGDPGGWAAKVREQALADSDNWRVSEPQGPPPWMSAAEIDLERRTRLPSIFARLFENRWTASEDRLTSPEDVRACVGHTGVLPPEARHRYVVALDVGLTNDRTVLTVAHLERRPDPVVVVDRQEVWQGTKPSPVQLSDVEPVVAEAVAAYRGARVVADPWQAAHLCQRLRARGVKVEEFAFSSASVGRLAVTLYRLLRDRAIDLPDEPELLDELSRVKLVETAPGSYRIDHASGEHDDRVISAALAALHLVDRPAGVDWTSTYVQPCAHCGHPVTTGTLVCPSCGTARELVEPTGWATTYRRTEATPMQKFAQAATPRGGYFGGRS